MTKQKRAADSKTVFLNGSLRSSRGVRLLDELIKEQPEAYAAAIANLPFALSGIPAWQKDMINLWLDIQQFEDHVNGETRDRVWWMKRMIALAAQSLTTSPDRVIDIIEKRRSLLGNILARNERTVESLKSQLRLIRAEQVGASSPDQATRPPDDSIQIGRSAVG
jgi:hypothetical protein